MGNPMQNAAGDDIVESFPGGKPRPAPAPAPAPQPAPQPKPQGK